MIFSQRVGLKKIFLRPVPVLPTLYLRKEKDISFTLLHKLRISELKILDPILLPNPSLSICGD